jgi:hypothetical protein
MLLTKRVVFSLNFVRKLDLHRIDTRYIEHPFRAFGSRFHPFPALLTIWHRGFFQLLGYEPVEQCDIKCITSAVRVKQIAANGSAYLLIGIQPPDEFQPPVSAGNLVRQQVRLYPACTIPCG